MTSATTASALDVLHDVFGYEEFRGQQAAIVDQVVGGGDAVVLMPTGGGKSLCYQIPALVRPGAGVVISPLIALMADQVAALENLGVRAAYLNSSLDLDTAAQVERPLLAGAIDPLSPFAPAGAPCLSQCALDFRGAYPGLGVLAVRLPIVPRTALTATATPATHAELTERLHLQGAEHFVASFDRPNITYRIEPKASARSQLLNFITTEHPGDARIVYCLSRRGLDQLAEALA